MIKAGRGGGRKKPRDPNRISGHEKPSKLQLASLFTTAHLPLNPVFIILHNKRRLRLRCRREFTPRPNLRPIPSKNDGYGHEDERDAAEKRAGPVHAERVEHVSGKQGKDGTEERAQEGVCCYG